MPASYYWAPPLGSDLSAATPSNWRIGSGPSLLASQPPDADDHLYFVGGLGQMDCLIPATLTASSGNAFAGIHLLFGPGPTTATGDGESGGGLPGLVGYWNTVTLADSFSVGALTVECGYISQGSSSVPLGNGSTLTVTASLSWTGGTLNSNSVPGFINLAPGATGVAEPSFSNPGINGKVYLGSTLTLNGTDPEAETGTGSTLNMIGGTFEVFRAQIIVDSFSNLFLIADEKADPLKGTIKLEREEDGVQTDSFLSVMPKGTATVTTSRADNSPDTVGEATLGDKNSDSAVINAGTVVVNNHTKLLLKGKPNSQDVAYIQRTQPAAPGGMANPAPTTRLETNSSIACPAGTGLISFADGRLEIPRRVIGTTPDVEDKAFLHAEKVWLKEAAVVVMTSPHWATLRIEGKFLYQGEFRAAIGRVSDLCDQIEVNGEVAVDPDKAKLTLRWQTSVPLAGQRVWPVVKSLTTDIADLPKDNLATLEEGNAIRIKISDNKKEILVYRQVD